MINNHTHNVAKSLSEIRSQIDGLEEFTQNALSRIDGSIEEISEVTSGVEKGSAKQQADRGTIQKEWEQIREKLSKLPIGLRSTAGHERSIAE